MTGHFKRSSILFIIFIVITCCYFSNKICPTPTCVCTPRIIINNNHRTKFHYLRYNSRTLVPLSRRIFYRLINYCHDSPLFCRVFATSVPIWNRDYFHFGTHSPFGWSGINCHHHCVFSRVYNTTPDECKHLRTARFIRKMFAACNQNASLGVGESLPPHPESFAETELSV